MVHIDQYYGSRHDSSFERYRRRLLSAAAASHARVSTRVLLLCFYCFTIILETPNGLVTEG